jgi:quercetin dioxygenase-like cupin family protein
MSNDAFDLSKTFIHLGLGSRAIPLPDFSWSGEYLAGYEKKYESDGAEGRLVVLTHQSKTWEHWERHPAGEEVVLLLSGRADLVQELDGKEHTIALHPGEAAINPPGVWHYSVVHEPGEMLFITPGVGTEHRPRG